MKLNINRRNEEIKQGFVLSKDNTGEYIRVLTHMHYNGEHLYFLVDPENGYITSEKYSSIEELVKSYKGAFIELKKVHDVTIDIEI